MLEPNPIRERLCNKDIAVAWGVDVRTVMRRAKLLKLSPTFPLHAHNEWSPADFERFEQLWLSHVRKCAQKKQPVYAKTPSTIPLPRSR